MSDARQYAIELLATAKGRHPKEPVMLLAERAVVLANAVIEGKYEAAPLKVSAADGPPPSAVKNPKEETLRLLEGGPLSFNDLHMALGNKNRGFTTNMVKALVSSKQVVFDEKKLELSLPAK